MKTTVHTRFIGALDALMLALAGGLKLALLLALFGPANGDPRSPSQGATATDHLASSAHVTHGKERA
jgi:hypothetical protein